MASKGNNRHMNRFAASNYLKVERKLSKYIAKQNAGRFTQKNSIALVTLLKEKMDVANDTREARLLLKKGTVSINGKVVREEKYPVGFGDVVSFASNGKSYRIDVAKHGFVNPVEYDVKGKPRLLKVIGKYVGKGGKIMIRLYDGTTLSGKNEIKVNDSVSIQDGAVKSVVKFTKGAKCYVIKGKHASESGVIKNIAEGSATRSPTVEIDSGKGTFQTLLENIMVTGE